MSVGGLWPIAVLALAAILAFELSRPDLLLVGNITVDLVDGTTPTGGAVSYAAVLAHALKARTCVVTVAGPEADLSVLAGAATLSVIPADRTLTFEHTYTWWGHSRKLRVTSNPNVTLSRADVPLRCRHARVVLLGPLTLHDVDARSFAHPAGLLDGLFNARQLVGLMAQGFQRDLSDDGAVLPLPTPSQQLLEGLGAQQRVSLFLSDVETDTWSEAQLQGVVSRAARVIITQGDKGALLLQGNSSSGAAKIPVVKVDKAVDTNGAGDTFATAFMLGLLRGQHAPGDAAAWAASRAVMQPQTCKPRCAPALVTAQPGGIAPLSDGERLALALAPLRQAAAALGPLLQLGWIGQLAQLVGLGSNGSAAASDAAAAAAS